MLSIDQFQANPAMIGFQDPLITNKKPQQDQNKINSGVDLSTGMLSVDQTQKILQQEIAAKLEARFEEEGIEVKGLKAEDFTPEKVSGRILDFVELGVSRAGDDQQKRMEMLKQAREGVDQGFEDAKEILDSLGVLQGKVKEDIEKTYALINNGLERLTYPDREVPGDENASALERLENATMSNTSSAESRSTSVEIMTRDGDKVTIDLVREKSDSSSEYYATDGESSVYGASYSTSSYTNIEYKVNGDIDEGEKKAIDDLLAQLNTVAKDFYQGNIETAFNKAKEVGFDSSELAKFSVDMSHQQINTSAVSTYQAAQQQSDNNGNQRKGSSLGDVQSLEKDNRDKAMESQAMANENAFIRDAADFMNQMDQLMKNKAFEFFENTGKAMTDLLDASLKLQYKKDGQSDNNDSKSPNYNSINEMVHALQDPQLS